MSKYFNLETNLLKYCYTNDNKIYGDTKHLVVSPLVGDLPPDMVRLNKPLVPERYMTSIDEYTEQIANQSNSSEITITFKPIYRAKYSDVEQAKIIRLMLQVYDINYILIPEFGQNMNLHYHGVIAGKSSTKSTVKKELLRLIGRTEIRNIQFVESYLQYLQKERSSISLLDYSKLIIFDL